MVWPIVQVNIAKGTTRDDRGTVHVNGRAIEPLVYPQGSRCNGSIFHDPDTGLYIKLGQYRAECERETWALAQKKGLAQHLAPIMLSGTRWNAFAAVDGEPVEEGSDAHAIAEDIGMRLGVEDLSHCPNILVTPDGTPVLIDYEF